MTKSSIGPIRTMNYLPTGPDRIRLSRRVLTGAQFVHSDSCPDFGSGRRVTQPLDARL